MNPPKKILVLTSHTTAWLSMPILFIVAFALAKVIGINAAWLLILGVFSIVILIGKPGAAVIFYIFTVGALGFAETTSVSPIIRFIDDCFIMLFCVLIVSRIVQERKPIFGPELRRFGQFVVAIMSIIAMSTIINCVPAGALIQFLLAYLFFIPVFLVTYRNHTAGSYKTMVGIMFIILLMQLIPNIGWSLGINPMPNYFAGTVDYSIGTLGSSTSVAYLSLACIYLTISIAFRKHVNPPLLAALLLVALLSVLQLYMTSTNHAYILLSAGFFVFILIKTPRGLLNLTATLIVASLMLATPLLLNSKMAESSRLNDISFNLSYWNLKSRADAALVGPKGEVIRNILFLAPDDMPAPIIGAGPGNFSSSIGCYRQSLLAQKYINYLFFSVSRQKELAGGSIMQQLITGAGSIWGEIGPLGFALYFGLYVYSIIRVFRQIRRDKYSNIWQEILATAYIPFAVNLLTVNFLTDIFYDDFLFGGLWIWTALVWTPADQMTQNIKEETTITEAV